MAIQEPFFKKNPDNKIQNSSSKSKNLDLETSFLETLTKAAQKYPDAKTGSVPERQSKGKPVSTKEQTSRRDVSTKKESKKNPKLDRIQNSLINNMPQLIAYLKNNILEYIISQKSEFEKQYHFKLNESSSIPLEISIKKTNNSLSINLSSSGIIKELLSNNREELINYLQNKGFEIANITLTEIPPNENQDKQKKKKKRDFEFFAKIEDNNIEGSEFIDLLKGLN